MLLALADKAVNEQAVALSPTLGWLLLGCAVAVILFFILHADRWRRWWLSAEDPRGIAFFRIVFAFFVMANINGMWDVFTFLYTDEGIFPADVARQVFASKQFAGFGDGMVDGEPYGFFDAAAIWEFIKGPKWSLLYFWDSPTAFWIHLIAFEVAVISLMIGFRTRLAAVLTWFLMNSILTRNSLGWEGTELVYRTMLVYLVFARSGHAYSVDNWLRCRKLRKQGRLSERDGPGGGAGIAPNDEYPQGLEPVYRRIPSWPRKLIMLQLATIYVTTGTLKTGSVWMAGDAMYYALNLDHFYRVPPQYLSSLGGTTVFRGMTYATKVGQMSFALVIFGIITRWAIAQGFKPYPKWRQWAIRGTWFALIGLTTAIIYVAYPVHYTPKISAAAFASTWAGLFVGIYLLWWKLGHKPFHFSGFGRFKLDTPVVIDRKWVSTWIIGRRVLLIWHLAFHGHIFTMMNVGQFQTGMMSATFAFISGHEIAAVLRDIGHRLHSWGVPGMPKAVQQRLPILPAADVTLPQNHHDAARLPMAALIMAVVGVLAGIIIQIKVAPEWDFRWVWVATFAFVAGFAVVQARRAKGRTDASIVGREPWAYGPIGRLIVGGAIVWHLIAVATWLMPAKDCLKTFRNDARGVFTFYLTRTTTDQGWGMFAPNPPRSNVFLKVMITDQNGETWDLRTDVYASEQKPQPWIWNDRMRKINRRVIGGESGPNAWYRKWYARYHCREWARTHDGVAPKRVDLIKIWYRIPTPEQTRKHGFYQAEELLERAGHERVSYTENCKHAVMGQLPNYIRERDGLPLLEEGKYKPWIKRKKKKWDSREEREAKKKEAARKKKEQAENKKKD